jgi:WD40 repeat protein
MGGDRAIKVWHGMPSPSRLFQGHKGPVRVAIFSPDRKYVLSCGGWPDGDRTLRLWDAATGKQLRILFTAPDILQSAAFTSDGKFALTGGEDGKVRMIEVATGALTRTFEEHKRGGIPHLVVAPDGKRFLTSSHDKTLKLWNIETGEVERTYAGHTDWVRFAAFHPDGKRIISGGRDQIVRIWDLESGKELHHFGHNNKWVESIAILPDGKRVLTGGGNDVMMWELDTGKLLRSYAGHAFGVTSIALSRDGSTVLSSSYDGSVRLWNVESGSSLARFGNHRNYVWSVALSPDGRSFLSAGGGAQVGGKFVPGEDFTIRMWPVPARMLAQH